jgi:hypothetical protein
MLETALATRRDGLQMDDTRIRGASVSCFDPPIGDLDENSRELHRQAPPLMTWAAKIAACVASERKEWNLIIYTRRASNQAQSVPSSNAEVTIKNMYRMHDGVFM